MWVGLAAIGSVDQKHHRPTPYSNRIKACSTRYRRGPNLLYKKMWPFPRRYLRIHAQQDVFKPKSRAEEQARKIKSRQSEGTVRTSCTRRYGPFLGDTFVCIMTHTVDVACLFCCCVLSFFVLQFK